MLPAILLAGLGFYSLRLDRLLALQEVTEQANKIAKELTLNLWTNALAPELPNPEAMARYGDTLVRPDEDPIVALACQRVPRIACLVQSPDRLVYPPSIAPAPEPQPLPEENLDPEQLGEWTALNQSSTHNKETAKAIEAGEQFLAHRPPERFVAIATYRLGLLLLKQGEITKARQMYEQVVDKYSETVTETGYPLKKFGQYQLLKLSDTGGIPAEKKEQLFHSLCSEAILRPSPLSASWLAQMTTLPSQTAQVTAWQQVWQVHCEARAFHAQFLRTAQVEAMGASILFQDRWLTLANGTNYLVMVLPVKGAQDHSGYWFTAISEDHARQLLAKALSPVVLPDYFSLSVEVAGKSLISVKEPMQVLATVGRASSSVALKAPDINGSGIMDSPNDKSSAKSRDSIQLKIYLSDPQRFYARQQTRTIWFVSLIALSMCAVLVGFLAAWRAFRRQLELNEMKSNFVSSVSHELRAPIASIGLMSEELEDIASQDTLTSRQYHQLIKRECRRLASLIENVLDFSRHEQGRKQYSFEATDMVALVEETVNIMRSYGMEQRVMLETKVHGQPLPAEVDVRAIQQALVNLIDNAIKHSPERANVLIGLEFDGDWGQPEKSGPVAQHQKHLRLWVEDHGPGIPPAEHEHIFERFYRRGSELRRETQGIGLGLAIVRYVTEAHGGRVIVRSAVGEGSRFTLELPVLNHENSA